MTVAEEGTVMLKSCWSGDLGPCEVWTRLPTASDGACLGARQLHRKGGDEGELTAAAAWVQHGQGAILEAKVVRVAKS